MSSKLPFISAAHPQDAGVMLSKSTVVLTSTISCEARRAPSGCRSRIKRGYERVMPEKPIGEERSNHIPVSARYLASNRLDRQR